MNFTYLKSPLNKYTFSAKSIKEWVESNCGGITLNLFAGKTLLDIYEVRNDIRESMPAHYHLDAFEFINAYKGIKFDTVILDPPYSYRKSMEMYEGAKISSFCRIKDELYKITKESNKVITLGYHSISMGQKRGYEIESLCLVSHGGAIHDTIITVENK